MGPLGGPELILILVIALIVFGPRKLPEIGKSMGKMLVEFRRASTDFKRTLETEVETEKRAPARQAAPTTPTVAAGSPPPAVSATPAEASGSSSPTPPPATSADPGEGQGVPDGSVPRDSPEPPAGGDR